jgi:hypothetical protein
MDDRLIIAKSNAWLMPNTWINNWQQMDKQWLNG